MSAKSIGLSLGYAIQELDSSCAEYFGCTEVVLSGPDLRILDGNNQPILEAPAQTTGIFLGTMFYLENGMVRVGYYSTAERVDTVNEGHSVFVENAAAVVGSVASSNIWASGDIFQGCANIRILSEEEDASTGSLRIEDLEHRLDDAVLNGALDMTELVSMFTDPDIMHSDLERLYFTRRLNVIAMLHRYILTGRASGVYTRAVDDEWFSLVGDSKPSDKPIDFALTGGTFFQVVATRADARMICLINQVRDDDGKLEGYQAVDLGSVNNLRAILVH